jgi:hypothetical protein
MEAGGGETITIIPPVSRHCTAKRADASSPVALATSNTTLTYHIGRLRTLTQEFGFIDTFAEFKFDDALYSGGVAPGTVSLTV